MYHDLIFNASPGEPPIPLGEPTVLNKERTGQRTEASRRRAERRRVHRRQHRCLSSSARGLYAPRSTCRYLRSLHTSEAETSKPCISAVARRPIFPPLSWARIVPAGDGKLIASDAHGGAGVGSWRKRMPACNGSDTGSEFARRESEQTSRRCLFAGSSGEPT